MLVMGLHPRVSTASTATMIVLTSSSVAVLYVTSGLVPWSYALFFFMVCFLGALILKSRIDAYVKRTGRASVLIFILASIILFATLGCIYNLLTGLSAKDWCLDGFKQFCTVSSSNDNCPADRFLSYGVSFLMNEEH
jgi:intracellular septation protein A